MTSNAQLSSLLSSPQSVSVSASIQRSSTACPTGSSSQTRRRFANVLRSDVVPLLTSPVVHRTSKEDRFDGDDATSSESTLLAALAQRPPPLWKTIADDLLCMTAQPGAVTLLTPAVVREDPTNSNHPRSADEADDSAHLLTTSGFSATLETHHPLATFHEHNEHHHHEKAVVPKVRIGKHGTMADDEDRRGDGSTSLMEPSGNGGWEAEVSRSKQLTPLLASVHSHYVEAFAQTMTQATTALSTAAYRRGTHHTSSGDRELTAAVFSNRALRLLPRTLPPPPTHAASENWNMVKRFGFPCSDDPAICEAEWMASGMLEKHESICEAAWSTALRGVPLLANATDETNAPLRRLCRKLGVPGHLRSLVWLTLSGVALRMEEHEGGLCRKIVETYGPYFDPRVQDAIEKDLDRTFPNHPYFTTPSHAVASRSAPDFDSSGTGAAGVCAEVGQVKLRRVLHALCWRNPLLTYCQSFNFIAGTFLLVTEDEEATFWLMIFAIEHLLPNDYYSEGLLGVKVDQEVVVALAHQCLPQLSRHFDMVGFDLRPLVPAWMLSMFLNTFPFETVIRIWDVMITQATTADFIPVSGSGGTGGSTAAAAGGGARCEFLIAVFLAFLKIHEGTLSVCDDSGEIMQSLTKLAAQQYDREELIREAFALRLRPDVLQQQRREHKTLVRQREQMRSVERKAYLMRQQQFRNASPSTPMLTSPKRWSSPSPPRLMERGGPDAATMIILDEARRHDGEEAFLDEAIEMQPFEESHQSTP